FDFEHSSATISGGSAILNFSHGLANAENARIKAGPDSLTIFSAGFHPNTGLGSYTTQGLTHIAGTDLLIPVGKTVRGAGDIDDFTIVGGTIDAADDLAINLNAGLELRSGAHADLGSGGVSVTDHRTLISGGDLSAGSLRVTGTFQYIPSTIV